MDTKNIVSEIDAEIARLQQARELLSGISTTAKGKRARPAGLKPQQGDGKSKPRRILSLEARARIAAAQKARWAKTRKAAASTAK